MEPGAAEADAAGAESRAVADGAGGVGLVETSALDGASLGGVSLPGIEQEEVYEDVDGAGSAAATLAAKENTTPSEVPLGQIHDLLKKHGAIIPGKA